MPPRVPSTSTKSQHGSSWPLGTKDSSHPFNPGYTTHASDTTTSWTAGVCSIAVLLLLGA